MSSADNLVSGELKTLSVRGCASQRRFPTTTCVDVFAATAQTRIVVDGTMEWQFSRSGGSGESQGGPFWVKRRSEKYITLSYRST
jgi:hypothetical protein